MTKRNHKKSPAANGDDAVASANVDAPAREAEEESRETAERQLKRLNSMLLKETVEKRREATVLAARVDELVAGAEALSKEEVAMRAEPPHAAGEEEVAMRAEPLHAAAEEEVAMRARLAEAWTVLENKAKDESMAHLEAAVAEKNRVLKLNTKEAELASVCKQVTDWKAVVAELERKNSELRAKNDELAKQLEEERYKEGMEEKLKAKVMELEALQDSRTEMEAKVESLQAELSAAAAKNQQLELEAEANKTEVDSVRREVEKLRSKVVEAEEKHMTMAAEADELSAEMIKLAKMKTEMKRESDALKRKVEQIKTEKDAAEGTTREQDAETSKVRTKLERLRISMAKLHAFCNDLNANHSRLQDEKDSVMKLLNAEKAEAGKLRSRIEELEKDGGGGVLKAELKDKGDKIDGLNRELELLQIAVAEAQRKRGKNGVSPWLCAATTTAVAAVSYVYATRRQ